MGIFKSNNIFATNSASKSSISPQPTLPDVELTEELPFSKDYRRFDQSIKEHCDRIMNDRTTPYEHDDLIIREDESENYVVKFKANSSTFYAYVSGIATHVYRSEELRSYIPILDPNKLKETLNGILSNH